MKNFILTILAGLKESSRKDSDSSDVIKAGEISINKYAEAYKDLEKYDKGELPETEKMVRSRDIEDFIQSV